MSNENCDHYWLVRRGGKCRHCGEVFIENHGGTLRALASRQTSRHPVVFVSATACARADHCVLQRGHMGECSPTFTVRP